MKAQNLNPTSTVSPLIQEEEAPEAGSFVRIEDKYLIEKSSVHEFLAGIQEHLKPSYPDPRTRFTLIQSIYFDSRNMDVYTSHFQSVAARFKLRTRRYAPDGIWSSGDESLLELKVKKDGVCKKSRYKLGRMENLLLMGGMQIPISEGLAAKNPELTREKLAKRLKRTNNLISEYRLRPVCAVTYSRLAFEKGPLRVTVDNDIQHRVIRPVASDRAQEISEEPLWIPAMAMANRYLDKEHLVVEIKHDGSVPAWLQDLVSRSKAQQASFSKYCFSVSQHIRRELHKGAS